MAIINVLSTHISFEHTLSGISAMAGMALHNRHAWAGLQPPGLNRLLHTLTVALHGLKQARLWQASRQSARNSKQVR